jgi:hypothetical protein
MKKNEEKKTKEKKKEHKRKEKKRKEEKDQTKRAKSLHFLKKKDELFSFFLFIDPWGAT